MTDRKKLILVDGSGYIFRAYHALPALTNPEGVAVGAVYGFVTMLSKLIDDSETDYMAVVFDAARQTFRNRLYEDYKANRDAPPEDLIPQFALVREATDALGLARMEVEDYEADDVIATYARLGKEQGMEVVIVSSDKDLMQLIDEDVRLHDPMKNKPIGEKEVLEKFGVAPDRVRHVLALMGDSSDNVPGVPGIGPKTAAQLLEEYGTLEELLKRAEEIKQNKRRENLIEFADQARLSYELVGLCDDVPPPCPMEELAVKPPEGEALIGFLQKQGFKSLVVKLKDKFGIEAEMSSPAPAGEATPLEVSAPEARDYQLVQTEAALQEWISKATKMGRVAIDTETTGLDAMTADLVGISLSVLPGEACYIPLGHIKAGSDKEAEDAPLFADSNPKLDGQLDLNLALKLLTPLLRDPAVLKIGQNLKYDVLILKKYGIEITPIDDTMLLSYVCSAGKSSHGMDKMAEEHLGVTTVKYDDVTGKGRNKISFAEVELEPARDYAAEDADITLRLWEVLKNQVITEKHVALYETIERPLVPVIVAMEQRGIKVDPAVLKHLSSDFANRMGGLEKEIYALAGETFNVGSPKQLGEILFEKMGLEGGKKSSKTGAYSTDSQVLEELAAGGHDLPAKVIEWRQLSKLKGTYTDALQEQIHPKTKRIHTSYSMASTTTGRLSSSDPNLQNIPIRTEEGRKIRTAFVAEPGNKLISADYSQIELRLLAHIAEVGPLKAAFKNGEDIHALTASQMFGVALDEVDGDMRRKAKTINFGIIYGISAHGLATRLGIGRSEAGEYIDAYFEQYPGIRAYMEQTKLFAREHGYVETLFGRRIHVPDIKSSNANRRQFSERAAINAPLQGTAADIIKRAMIATESMLEKKSPDTRMLLQVHDELIFETPESEVDKVLSLIISSMEKAADLSIPLTVEANAGDNWGEIH